MKRVVTGIITGAAVAALFGLVPTNARGQCCGDCDGDGAVLVDELVTAVNRALTGCSDDGSRCGLLATGQTANLGAGSDGDVQAGAPLSYTDNGDGTLTDNNTGLMWEKKDDSGGLHDMDNVYTWTMAGVGNMDGTMVTEFLAALNTAPCFAGHCDWRIPNVRELQSLVDYGKGGFDEAAVDAAFDTAECTGCTDVMQASCSCTSSGYYWSSTRSFFTSRFFSAWTVLFGSGDVSGNPLGNSFAVRAVRGGL